MNIASLHRVWVRVACIAALAALAGCSGSPVVDRPATRTVTNASSANPAGAQGSIFGTPGNPRFYEVFGERYFVMPTSDGYRERGIASWYGPKFHGKPTSGGEIYNMHGMTAAHKTLPIPTWVEVTNVANGRQVIVRVNDRGPFVDDRIIDLSYRAAQELDMIGDGTARVQVRALGAPVGGPEPGGLAAPVYADAGASGVGTAEGSADTADGGFALISSAHAAPVASDDLFVQVGAFSDRDNALGLVSRLKRSGFENTFLLAGGMDALYRVRIGPLADERHFDEVQSALNAIGVGGSRLVSSDL